MTMEESEESGVAETEVAICVPCDVDSTSTTLDDQLKAPQPTNTTGSSRTRHGARNNYKMKLFVKWLQEKFPHAFEDDSDKERHILDVAGGGKGELATRLAWCCQRRVVIVDPRPADLVQCLEKTVLPQLPKKWQQRAYQLAQQRDNDNSTNSTRYYDRLDELVEQHTMCFTHSNIILSETNNKESAILVPAIKNASVLVGMHADGATEPIVDAALHYQKPFVVVPCCVFPNLFPQRTVLIKNHNNQQTRNEKESPSRATGEQQQQRQQDDVLLNEEDEPSFESFQRVPVRSYEQFCQYLLEKDSRFQSAVLPFPGRNVAIWWDGKD